MYIDTHAHLDFPEFKTEVPAVLGRARESHVERIINVGVDYETSKHSLDLARKYPEIYAAVGVHPHCAKELSIEMKGQIMTLANHEKVVAIGEIGLDYYHLKRSSQYAHYPNRDEQIFCFEQMLDLALETGLPAIIHNREADADILGILKSYHGQLRAVVHCFSSNADYAEKILDLGFAISFTGNITYKNPDIHEAIKKIPLGSMMIETDCPYLAPAQYRGKRNESAYVIETARKIAQLKGLSLAEVEEETTKKAKKFFGLK
ncbi:MAG: TatD family hydrolase [Candidatus Berkelbacteria bacterium]|nr:TatD family hydrolase [Candidatus Berkelbacteria bacterium]